MNGTKSIAFDYTDSIITITETLPYGNYNLTINYLGSETYINSSKVIAVKYMETTLSKPKPVLFAMERILKFQ